MGDLAGDVRSPTDNQPADHTRSVETSGFPKHSPYNVENIMLTPSFISYRALGVILERLI
jgi:hypothetical protein